MLERLKELDASLFLYLNGKHGAFFDPIMYWASDPYIWIPLYIALFIYLYFRFRAAAYYYYAGIIVQFTLTDQLSSVLIKDIVLRPRPSHEPALMPYIHLSAAGPGGQYGFTSNHAANTFGLAFFLLFVLPPKYRWLKVTMIAWAALVSYSRIYNGVHYPGDVLGGMIVGLVIAFFMAKVFRHFLGTYLAFVGKRMDKRRMREEV